MPVLVLGGRSSSGKVTGDSPPQGNGRCYEPEQQQQLSEQLIRLKHSER